MSKQIDALPREIRLVKQRDSTWKIQVDMYCSDPQATNEHDKESKPVRDVEIAYDGNMTLDTLTGAGNKGVEKKAKDKAGI